MRWSPNISRETAAAPTQPPTDVASAGAQTLGLIDATKTGDAEMVRKLLSKGADKEAKNERGETPLHRAASEGHASVVDVLIREGADKEAKDNDDWTPLHQAAHMGHAHVVNLLIRDGADKEAKDKDGATPLHRAAYCGQDSVVEVLIRAGADKEAKDNDGWTPLRWAEVMDNTSVVEMLHKAGVSESADSEPDSANEKKMPPIVSMESTLTLDLGGDVKLELVIIPPGKFIMGRPAHDKGDKTSDEPQHEVTISRAFYMGKYVVTQDQYEKVMGTNPSRFKGAKNPVDNVFWDDAQDFCKKVTATTGKALRLPTEAEWEYACRAGSATPYCFGDRENQLALYAWCLNIASLWWSENKALRSNSNKGTHPVGKKKPNRWGLYDMHGNVREWCQDRFGIYSTGAVTDPQGPTEGEKRVLRGGDWSTPPDLCGSASRFAIDLAYFSKYSWADACGFRIAVETASKTL